MLGGGLTCHGAREGRIRASRRSPPGQYKVVITAADEELAADKLAIGIGSDVTLTVALKDGHFVIVRQ